jgi:hypothetical protein
LGVGGHQAHKEQVRAAILAHAYEAAARAQPPPLTGDGNGGAHSRVKADQVRAKRGASVGACLGPGRAVCWRCNRPAFRLYARARVCARASR